MSTDVLRPTPLPRAASATSLATGLRCAQCGALTELAERTACPDCFGPLHVVYDLGPLRGRGPDGVLGARGPGIWRYRELLPPVSGKVAERLEVGPSPLRRARRLEEAWGLRELWIKDETVLPSGSFKDRPAAVAVAVAQGLGFPAVGCASTGNLAAATARAASRLGLPCPVLVPAGLPEAKLLPVLLFGGQLVEVDGTYDDANRLANLLAEQGRIGLVNVTLRPFYTEGSKTIALEALEQLRWEAPDWIGVPLGSGALLAATHRALEQLAESGWLPSSSIGSTALFGSQPVGCTPIVDAFLRGEDRVLPTRVPDSIAESLAIGDPASGPEALRAIRSTGGFADAPTSEEVRQAIGEVARLEGIWTEPAGGTVLASLRRKLDDGVVDRSDRVVVFLTGAGWKTPNVLGSLGTWARPRVQVGRNEREIWARLDLASAPNLWRPPVPAPAGPSTDRSTVPIAEGPW